MSRPHTAASGSFLWHRYPQSLHPLCSQQREQHPLHAHGPWKRYVHADKRKQRRSCWQLCASAASSSSSSSSSSASFLPLGSLTCRCFSRACRPLGSHCIHSNVFYRLTMNRFFVWTLFRQSCGAHSLQAECLLPHLSYMLLGLRAQRTPHFCLFAGLMCVLNMYLLTVFREDGHCWLDSQQSIHVLNNASSQSPATV